MSCQNGKPAFNVFRYLKKRCTMTPPSRTPGDTDQHQLFRKRHPRLRHEKKNLRRDRQRQGPRCARHHAGACQNLHEVEIVVLRIHRRPPRHPRAKNPAPRKPHPASPRINPTSLAREFAPFTLIRVFALCHRWNPTTYPTFYVGCSWISSDHVGGNCSRPHSGRSWNWAGVGVAEKV